VSLRKPLGRFGGLFFCGIAMIFVAIGSWLAYSQARALRTYLPAPAKLLSRTIQTSHDTDGGDTYTPGAEYRYVVNGQTYECKQVTVTNMSSSHSWAQGQLAKLPEGRDVTAYYNPADPSDAFLIHEPSFFPYLFVLFPMIFISIGLGVMFPGKKSQMTTRSLLPIALLWNGIGLIVAVQYHSLGGGFDLVAKVALCLYGLIGGLALYAAVYHKIEERALTAAVSAADSR
jgi:hypothetical protein